jgi:hypothetical protein
MQAMPGPDIATHAHRHRAKGMEVNAFYCVSSNARDLGCCGHRQYDFADRNFRDRRRYVRDRRHGKGLQINGVYCASSAACDLRRRRETISRSISAHTFSSCCMNKGTNFLERLLKRYDVRAIVFVCNSPKLNVPSNRPPKAFLPGSLILFLSDS